MEDSLNIAQFSNMGLKCNTKFTSKLIIGKAISASISGLFLYHPVLGGISFYQLFFALFVLLRIFRI